MPDISTINGVTTANLSTFNSVAKAVISTINGQTLVTSTLPTQSVDFESSSSQYLSMSDANFGAFDYAKWAFSAFIKRESTGVLNHTICGKRAGVGQRSFYAAIVDDKLDIVTYNNGSTINGRLTTTATYTSTASWYHLLFHFDSANATASDRMRLWVNGSEVTSFDVDTNPTAAIFDSTADMNVGGPTGIGAFDGLIYNFAFFSGSLPTVGQLYSAGMPLTVVGLPGLYSTLDVAGGDVTHDGVLSTNWTNNNTVVASSTIP